MVSALPSLRHDFFRAFVRLRSRNPGSSTFIPRENIRKTTVRFWESALLMLIRETSCHASLHSVKFLLDLIQQVCTRHDV